MKRPSSKSVMNSDPAQGIPRRAAGRIFSAEIAEEARMRPLGARLKNNAEGPAGRRITRRECLFGLESSLPTVNSSIAADSALRNPPRAIFQLAQGGAKGHRTANFRLVNQTSSIAVGADPQSPARDISAGSWHLHPTNSLAT